MQPIDFPRKRSLTALVCLSLLVACGPPGNNGYYDGNSRYVRDDQGDSYDRGERTITLHSGADIPERMFPASGMCRVWFPDRLNDHQPAPESCQSIHAQDVPDNAYVIVGR